jgi:diguanylate cyclase (GGDEF)-like protein
MGKLAVPEYILNKPGKLTETEFDKMKLHASIGADILSAIAFPYPVVPIVRHHHENWDGSGYPGRLRGTDIPIGARILSVVDCFDALTSDRPYRPRLSDQEAIRILIERRGTMYDPLIVDTFIRVYEGIRPDQAESGPPQQVLSEIASARKAVLSTAAAPMLEEITASADEMLTLYELAQGLAGQVSLNHAGDMIAKHLRRLVPSSLTLFYIHDRSKSELEVRHAVGEGASTVVGIRIPVGQRLSGWVAANRQTIVNSDPILDLGDAARSHALALRSCLSTSLVSGEQLVGVLSLYSSDANGFTEDHRRIVEAVAHQIAHTFERALELDVSVRRDEVTGLPCLSQLERLLPGTARHTAELHKVVLLFIDVVDFTRINETHGRTAGDDVLRHVVANARAGLRVGDILFRNTGDEFVAFLNDTDLATAELVAQRIQQNIARVPVAVNGTNMYISAAVLPLTVPKNWNSLPDLLATARRQTARDQRERKTSFIH